MVLEDIEKAKKIITNDRKLSRVKLEEYFAKIYSFSTENLNGYLKHFSFNDKLVLTTGSSADQIFNLINYGANEINHFDVNPFVKYYFSLKKTAILELSPEKYLDFFHISKKKSKHWFWYERLYHKLSGDLDDDSKLFWDSLHNTFEPNQIWQKLFFPDEISRQNITFNNSYLNKQNYHLIRKKIASCHINFINTNVTKLLDEKKQYDCILLSNILDYLYNLMIIDESEFREILFVYRSFLIRLTEILKEDGVMFFHYFWKVGENDVYKGINNFLQNDEHISTIFFENADGIKNVLDGVMVYTKKK